MPSLEQKLDQLVWSDIPIINLTHEQALIALAEAIELIGWLEYQLAAKPYHLPENVPVTCQQPPPLSPPTQSSSTADRQ